MIPSQTIGFYCLVAGLSMLAGWWIAFRNRPYLLSLGISFLALAAALIISDRARLGPPSPALQGVFLASVGVAVLAFLVAAVLAVQETRRRIHEMREHYRAAAEALAEMARSKEQQLQDKPAQDEPEGKEKP